MTRTKISGGVELVMLREFLSNFRDIYKNKMDYDISRRCTSQLYSTVFIGRSSFAIRLRVELEFWDLEEES